MKKEILKKSMRYYPEETEEYWKRHRSELLASTLSRRMYCKTHGVNYNCFNYWFKKLSPPEEIEQFGKKSPSKKSFLLPVHLEQTKTGVLPMLLCTLNLKY